MTIKWKIVERPGYFGRHREARQAEYDARYGPGDWKIVWKIGERLGAVSEAVMLYEDAYYNFLVSHPKVLELLCAEASEVYDDALSNIGCGLDYAAQETDRTHLQDIAIRRCLVRLGRSFRGSRPIQIRDNRGEHELSMVLSPGRVLFHRPDLITGAELEGWWLPGSVESFYQSNKHLAVGHEQLDG